MIDAIDGGGGREVGMIVAGGGWSGNLGASTTSRPVA
jgi:hypothetical protein